VVGVAKEDPVRIGVVCASCGQRGAVVGLDPVRAAAYFAAALCAFAYGACEAGVAGVVTVG
jgi:hypothetical protein